MSGGDSALMKRVEDDETTGRQREDMGPTAVPTWGITTAGPAPTSGITAGGGRPTWGNTVKPDLGPRGYRARATVHAT